MGYINIKATTQQQPGESGQGGSWWMVRCAGGPPFVVVLLSDNKRRWLSECIVDVSSITICVVGSCVKLALTSSSLLPPCASHSYRVWAVALATVQAACRYIYLYRSSRRGDWRVSRCLPLSTRGHPFEEEEKRIDCWCSHHPPASPAVRARHCKRISRVVGYIFPMTDHRHHK
jgi:hypothetical protein